MDIFSFGPGDDAVLDWVAVRNAVSAHDTPWEWPLTEHEARGMLRYGWDLEPRQPWLVVADGVAVGAGAIKTSERDNRDSAWLEVGIHPDHRRRGHGSAFLEHLEATCLERGRSLVGGSTWEAAGCEAFALGHGYERRQVGVNRRQVLAEVDRDGLESLWTAAVAAAGGYELIRWPSTTPQDQLDAVAAMAASINDAPTDDLEIEDDVFDGERVRAFETAQHSRGYRIYRLVARHRDTGELAGETLVGVDAERPHLAEQLDTSVAPGHRGHRLGALLKTGMLLWLGETEPQVAEIDTFNAESNDFMIGINEALGYRVMGREFNLQKRLR